MGLRLCSQHGCNIGRPARNPSRETLGRGRLELTSGVGFPFARQLRRGRRFCLARGRCAQDVVTVSSIVERLRQCTDHLADAVASAQAAVQKQKNRWSMRAPWARPTPSAHVHRSFSVCGSPRLRYAAQFTQPLRTTHGTHAPLVTPRSLCVILLAVCDTERCV